MIIELLAIVKDSRVSITIVGSVLCVAATVLPAVASAQSANTPSYISSMTPFEAQALDGNTSPSNGTSSMESITPREWLDNDPSVEGLSAVISAWSGGAKGQGTKMIVHGGGHSDSANNGIYIFDYSGTDAPTGWQEPLVISDVSDVQANGATYADGKPVSVHTYDGMVYADHNNHAYRIGGSRFNNGFMTNAAFKFDLASKVWTKLPDFPGAASGPKTVYDSATGKIFVTMTDEDNGYFFRTSSETWSGNKTFGGSGFPYNSMVAWDSKRNRGIVVGDGTTKILSIDFGNETVSSSSFSPSGNTEIFGRDGISAVYDPIRDSFWLFGGGDSSPGWDSIYEMTAGGSSWSVTRYNLTGDSISTFGGAIGSWGRYVLMPQWRAIGVIASSRSPAYVIRLPSDSFKTPEPPFDLTTD